MQVVAPAARDALAQAIANHRDAEGRSAIHSALKHGHPQQIPSMLEKGTDPNLRDDRTEHESVAVGSGTKYAANYWLHMWDFQEPTRHGCGNTEVFGNW